MPSRPAAPLRRAIVWLLVLLLPLQTLAASVVAAAGPSHVHRPAAAAQGVLDDFRRAPVRPARSEAHVGGAWGHFHVGVEAERHPHRASDASVIADGNEAHLAADAGDLGSGSPLGAFCGFVSSSPSWTGDRTGERPAMTARWTPQTHDPALPERPPRGA